MFAPNLLRLLGVRYAPVRFAAMTALAVGYLALRTDPSVVDWVFAAVAVALGVAGSAAPLPVALAQAALLGAAAVVGGEGPAVVLVKIMASFAVFELAARRRLRWAGIAAVALVAGSLAGKLDRLPQELAPIAYGLVVVLGVPLLLGAQLRSAWRLAEQAQRRAEAEGSRARAESERAEAETRRAAAERSRAESERRRAEAESRRAEAEIGRREADALAARASERATIARELHDLVAHQIASILLRVGVARQVLPDLAPPARETFDDVYDCAATVLDDLRRLVRVLRSGEGGSLIDPAGLREAVAETARRARRLGLDVTTTLDDTIGAVEAVRALTVLRLCQEGLTNVAKHGGPAARVELAVRLGADGAIRLSITDDGRGETGTGTDAASADGGGYGLVGMRERVELLGGELDVGPTATGWRLSAVLPRPAETESTSRAAAVSAGPAREREAPASPDAPPHGRGLGPDREPPVPSVPAPAAGPRTAAAP